MNRLPFTVCWERNHVSFTALARPIGRADGDKRDIFTPTLLEYADQALYYSKHHGRNQTTFFEDLLDQRLVKAEEFTPGDISLF